MGLHSGPLLGSHGNDLVVANALIWAALILAVSTVLSGTDFAGELLPLVVTAAGASVVLLSFGLKQVRRETIDHGAGR
jgi:hypothetical protein